MINMLSAYGRLRRRYNLIAAIVLIGLLFAGQSRAETVIVAAFGDSLTAGYGLRGNDGFVPQLQAWLTENGHEVKVLNAGVSGDTTAGGRARIAWTLTDDVDAVIVELGGNDFLRGLPPASARDNLDAIMQEIHSRGLPVLIAGLPAPPNFGPAYKTSFDAIYPELAQTYGALLYPDFFAEIRKEGTFAGLPALMQSDGIHPNKEGVARIVEGIGPMVAKLVEAARAGK